MTAISTTPQELNADRGSALPWWLLVGGLPALAAVIWAGQTLFAGGLGFPLDDSYIHLEYARAFAEGRPFEFNPGTASTGLTAPLWALCLAMGYWVVGDWWLSATVWGLLGVLGTALAVAWLVRRWGAAPRWAGLAAVWTLITGWTLPAGLSGMETPLAAAVALAALACYGRGRRRSDRLGGALLWSVAVWLRPEYLMMLPAMLIDLAWQARCRTIAWRELLLTAMAFAIPLVPYVMMNVHYGGGWLPSTFAVKAVLVTDKPAGSAMLGLPAALRLGQPMAILKATFLWPMICLAQLAIALVLCNAVFLGFTRHGQHVGNRPGPSPMAWFLLLGYPAVRFCVHPTPPGLGEWRYWPHLIGLLVALGVVGYLARFERTAGATWPPRRFVAMATTCSLIGWLIFAGGQVLAVSNVNHMQVRVARWIEANTEPNALVAANDVGAIRFLTRRRVLDTVALTEPALIEHYGRGGMLESYLRRQDPELVVMFPNWHHGLICRSDLFEPVLKVRLEHNVVCGGPEMWVCRTRFDKPDAPAG